MAKSADYLDPNRDLEQEELYYAHINKLTIRQWLALKLKELIK
jgi:hypothetical protein